MASVILSQIPEICTREDILQQLSSVFPDQQLDYVLYPLGKDETKAMVNFKSQRSAELMLRQQLCIFGAPIKSRPAPRQTYQKCTAEVDPLTLASIPDLQQCIHGLQSDFGVDVTFAHDSGTMVLTGSLMQIQCAQTKLDAIFREEQESQARELLMVEQDLATPRSQRSLSIDESMNVGTQPRPVQSCQEPVTRSQAARERLLNTMPPGGRDIYDQRPKSSFDIRTSYKSSTVSSTAKQLDDMFEQTRPGSSMSATGGLSRTKKSTGLQQSVSGSRTHRGIPEDVLPQGVFDDDGFTIRGVKIQRHSSTEEQKVNNLQKTEEIGRPEDNPLRHTTPSPAWGRQTITPATMQSTQAAAPRTANIAPRMSPPPQGEPYVSPAKEQVRIKDGKEYLSLTIELDGDVMGYIKKIHKPEIKELELKQQVQFSNRWGEEVMEVRITTAVSEQDGGQQKLQKARDEFVGFYQTVFYSVVKETVDYDMGKVDESEVDAVVTAVGKAFASRVFVSNRCPGEIILVGSWDYLPLVRDWVIKKLVHTGGVIHKSSKSKHKSETKGRPQPVSQNTWVGPSSSKSRPKQSSRMGATMPIKAAREEGNVRSSGRTLDSDANTTTESTPAEGTYYEHYTREGVHVLLYGADITQVQADVVVNASNESLHHIGNIAASISECAGPQLQQQCTDYVTQNGPLRVSEVMCTPGVGDLKCSHVIHAVGPMWCLFTNKDKCAEVLKQTFLNTLFYANNKLKARSLVMPAIGTGVYGIPLDVCTRAMYDAITSFSRAASSLKEIHVVDLEQEAAGMMSIIFTQLTQGDCGAEAEDLQIEELDDSHVSRQSVNIIKAVSMEAQHGRAPRQNTGDWPESPPPLPGSARGAGSLGQPSDEEGPPSPPPSPLDSDYEEPYSVVPGPHIIPANMTQEVHSVAPPSARLEIQSHEHNKEDKSGDVTPKSGSARSIKSSSNFSNLSNSSGSIKSGDVTPRSGIKSRDVTPRGTSIKSGDVTPKQKVKMIQPQITSEDMASALAHVRSGEVTPRAESIRSGSSTPREKLMIKPQLTNENMAASFKSGEATPRAASIRSGNSTPRATSVRSGDITPRAASNRSGGVTPRADSIRSGDVTPRQQEILIKPQTTNENMAGMKENFHNLPQSDESDGSRQSTAMQELLPESEAQLLAQARTDTQDSDLSDLTLRPRVKSPSSELFNQNEIDKSPLLIRLVASAVCMAEKAADIIRDVMKQGDLGIVEKGVNDLQTEADRSAERCIVASLQKQFPGITVVGEESTFSADDNIEPSWIETSQSVEVLQYAREVPDDLRGVKLEDIVVWVDPLDGTNEYTQGLLDHVTTLIGIAVKGRAVAGVISQPYHNYQAGPDKTIGRTIWGVVGVGAFGFTPASTPQGQNIVCTTRSHSNQIVNLSVDACEPTEVLRVGGSGHKVLLLLEGQAHAYVFASPGTKKWDTCGPEAVLHALGGKLTDIHGHHFQYDAGVQRKNSGGVLATANIEAHQWYASKIPQQVLDELPTEGTPVWQLADQLTAKLRRVEAPLILQVLAASVCIAERSGEIIRGIMDRGELGIVEKGVNDLQTEADRSAQRCILASLRKQFNGIKVVGEEDEDTNDTQSEWVETNQSDAVLKFTSKFPDDLKNVQLEDLVVWVDPLDGTAEYTQGLLDHVTTLIGIAHKGRAVAGVVYQPFYNYQAGPEATKGRSVWGAVGLGAFGFTPKHPPEGENIICTTRSHSNRNVTMSIDACDASEVLRVGGSGHKVLLILEGKAHAYVFATPGTKKWDTCGPEAVLHAQGGHMTDMLGNEFQYHADVQRQNKAGVLATPFGVKHKWYKDRIPEEVSNALETEGPAPWQEGSIPLILQVLAASVCIAERSGEIIRGIMDRGELGIVEKGVNDLQTEADRSAQRCILASLRKQFNGIKVVGEEDEDTNDTQSEWVETNQSDAVLKFTSKFPDDLKNVQLEDLVVWVDPLDGTAEYTQGLLDHVTTLIGIAHKGRAVAGVVYQPFYNYQAGPEATKGRSVWGAVGLGAFGFTPKHPPEGENIICTTRSHSNRNVTMSIDACDASEVLRVGGSGHKVLLILEGKAHAYVFATPGTKKWDTCGPEAVLHAQGGHMTDMLGNEFQYHADVQRQNKAGVLATPFGVKHKWYKDRIPEEVRNALETEGPAPWQEGSIPSTQGADSNEAEDEITKVKQLLNNDMVILEQSQKAEGSEYDVLDFETQKESPWQQVGDADMLSGSESEGGEMG